jgi:hypothetical protein
MSLNLKQVLLKILDYAKEDTQNNAYDLYIKYDKIFKATYTLINEQPETITIQYLIDRFKFKLFELVKFTKACGVLSQYEATCDTSIVIKFSKIPRQYFVNDVGFIDETDTRPFNEIVKPLIRNVITAPRDVVINIPEIPPLLETPVTPRKSKFFTSSKIDIMKLPDKKEEIIKKFNEEIENITSSDSSVKFKDIKIENLRTNLEKIMKSDYIRTCSDIKEYNFMKGKSVDIIDTILNRKA